MTSEPAAGSPAPAPQPSSVAVGAAASNGGATAAPTPNMLGQTVTATAWGPGLSDNLDVGDAVMITAGVEKYDGFEVGPFAVTIRKRQGETNDALFLRGQRMVDVMFETSLELKRRQYAARKG